jgi:hypothetical protein
MLLFFNAHIHSFKTRLGLRSRFQVLTGSPCRPCQFCFFFKSKRRRFSKKTKKNKSQRVCNWVLTGFFRVNQVAGSHQVFSSLVFFSTRPDSSPGSPGPGLTNQVDRVSKLCLYILHMDQWQDLKQDTSLPCVLISWTKRVRTRRISWECDYFDGFKLILFYVF